MKELKFSTFQDIEDQTKQAQIDLENSLFIDDDYICFNVRGRYDIELKRCKDHAAILEWVHHMSCKQWMTVDLIHRFIGLTTAYHDLVLYRGV